MRWAAAGLVCVFLLAACEADGEPRSQQRSPVTGSAPAPVEEGVDQAGPAITLAFAGDVHFEDGLAEVASSDRGGLGPMSATLRSADLAMVNLEAALTDTSRPTMKELEEPGNRYWFRAPTSALDALGRSGVDVVSVANDHGADYGVAGVRDTVTAAGPVTVVGAGLDAEAAFAPYRTTIRGTDVAVLAADASALESRDPVWAARPGSGPGLASARGDDRARLLAAVEASAAADDLVVVYLHWGEEGDACPTRSQETLAAALSDAGADVVVGTHAHVPLAGGMLGDTYVGYGLGNFFWYHGIRDETGVLKLRVRDGAVVADTWVPGEIRPNGGAPQPLTGAARTEAVEDWRALRACSSLAAGPSETATTPAPAELPAYVGEVRPIGAALRQRMSRGSHALQGCPVGYGRLRHLTLSYVDFQGRPRTGGLVVNADVADEVVGIFAELYAARFPIARMRLVDEYGADDDRSMAANNTSAFNCRRVAGQTTWSDHAYGRAVDLNPVQNPYVVGGVARPPAGSAYVETRSGAGVIGADGVVARTFAAAGWEWGGRYSEPDYQHFSVG